MVIKHIIKRLIQLVCISMLCGSSCIKNIGRDCSRGVYFFELPFKAKPDTDSIKLGESITFTVDVPAVFKDLVSGKEIDYSGAANLGSAIYFVKLDTPGMTITNAADQFTYSLKTGDSITPIDPTLYRAYKFAESNGRYKFELVIKPKSSGLYRVVFSDSGNTYRDSDPCTKAGFTINLEETRHNRHLEGIDDEALPGGDFHFYVSP